MLPAADVSRAVPAGTNPQPGERPGDRRGRRAARRRHRRGRRHDNRNDDRHRRKLCDQCPGRRAAEVLVHRICRTDGGDRHAISHQYHPAGRQPGTQGCRGHRIRHDGKEVGDLIHHLDQGRRPDHRHGRVDNRHGTSGQGSRTDYFGQLQPQQQQRIPVARRGIDQCQPEPSRRDRWHPRRRHARPHPGRQVPSTAHARPAA